MATNLPILQIPHIAQPCDQSWEQMPGSARVRHCAACNQDVVNLAAMSAAEIAALLQGPGPLPARRPPRRRHPRHHRTVRAHGPCPAFAAGLLTAALSVTAAAAAGRPSPQLRHPPRSKPSSSTPRKASPWELPPAARQTAPTAAPTKPPVPSRQPPPHVTMGKILPPVHKPLPNPLPDRPQGSRLQDQTTSYWAAWSSRQRAEKSRSTRHRCLLEKSRCPEK